MDSSAFNRGVPGFAAFVGALLLVGAGLGGILFHVIPWLWRHIDVRWLP